MIIIGDASVELEFHPKLPENATPERQDEIMSALHKMLTEGKVYAGTSESYIEWWKMPGNKSLTLRVRLPDARITIA